MLVHRHGLAGTIPPARLFQVLGLQALGRLQLTAGVTTGLGAEVTVSCHGGFARGATGAQPLCRRTGVLGYLHPVTALAAELEAAQIPVDAPSLATGSAPR